MVSNLYDLSLFIFVLHKLRQSYFATIRPKNQSVPNSLLSHDDGILSRIQMRSREQSRFKNLVVTSRVSWLVDLRRVSVCPRRQKDAEQQANTRSVRRSAGVWDSWISSACSPASDSVDLFSYRSCSLSVPSPLSWTFCAWSATGPGWVTWRSQQHIVRLPHCFPTTMCPVNVSLNNRTPACSLIVSYYSWKWGFT